VALLLAFARAAPPEKTNEMYTGAQVLRVDAVTESQQSLLQELEEKQSKHEICKI